MPVLSRCRYDLVTSWRFVAPIDAVWDAIVDVESWPGWWAGVERVEVLAPGDPSGVGARRRYVCRSALPFRLSFVSCVTRVEPLRLLEGRVEGELQGIGQCHFGREANVTTVRYEWHVRTTRTWMNLLAPLVSPLLRWNHDQLMRAGGIGLAQHLAARQRLETFRSA